MNLDKFKTKRELFQYLKENKSELIGLKKSAIKICDSSSNIEKGSGVDKTDISSNQSGVLNKTFIGNTYYWMDSHDDVHVGNTFKKSISENKNIFHLHDHEFKLTSRVGHIQSIEEKSVAWKELGVNKDGNTTSLVVSSNVLKELNPLIYKDYLQGNINQHSVGMYYVKIDLAINDPEMKEEFEEWNKHIDLLGNKERAEERGFFWAVKEAKLSEVSAVLLGSNSLTDIYEPSNDTQKEEPSKDTLKIDYDYLIKNL